MDTLPEATRATDGGEREDFAADVGGAGAGKDPAIRPTAMLVVEEVLALLVLIF